jgi:hypothetical protein
VLIQDLVGKHVIGHVGHGKMKILEVINLDSFNADEYDLGEDLIFFMNNDPAFYRHQYYPSVLKLRDCNKSGIKFESDQFKPMVEKAYKEYYQKFPVKNLKQEITNEIIDEVCTKVYESELDNIKQGHYDIKK